MLLIDTFLYVFSACHTRKHNRISSVLQWDNRNVNSSTTTLIVTAQSLPDDVLITTVVVMVTAINRYGIGPDSDDVNATVTGTYIYYADV